MHQLCFLFSLALLLGCNLEGMVPTAQKSIIPTEQEVAAGLIESLSQGMQKGTAALSVKDGFYANALVKIPFPEQAQPIQKALETIGAEKLIADTTLSLNRAAEDASGVAKDVLIQAVKALTFQDAMHILLGPDHAATEYLRTTTSDLLLTKFTPIIQMSLDKVHATRYWNDVMTKYNQINIMNVFGPAVETDLTHYVAQRALSGLFVMVEKEEKNIRQDPLTRTTALLQKVFSYADRQQAQ
ncbi:MAG: DUF4197 domain-containing protein [Deltaproteobacteria bacterium]|nr:DUF4197 domain-containing protein [Deltaproteobacteria bacterium]